MRKRFFSTDRRLRFLGVAICVSRRIDKIHCYAPFGDPTGNLISDRDSFSTSVILIFLLKVLR